MTNNQSQTLQKRVICPNCWRKFKPAEALWVSEHTSLNGDPLLGPDYPSRFLPTRFDENCNAIDVQGRVCHHLACPHCHLIVPRACIEMAPMFISILGAPASGKSCFLAAMTWMLRQTLQPEFLMSFTDADPAINRTLNEYEELQYMSTDTDRVVAIRKTELQGDQYETVTYGDQSVTYLRPFVFLMRPTEKHPNFASSRQVASAVCMYDNAGEHFSPGEDKTGSPVTQHLGQSEVLMFTFDPTQDARFRKACAGKTKDPQFTNPIRTARQETVLVEAANRIRRHKGLSYYDKHDKPLIVVVTKFDAWADRFGGERLPDPWVRDIEGFPSAMNWSYVQDVSRRIRSILEKLCPELVTAAEDFATDVTYIPVSAFGRPAQLDEQTGVIGVKPGSVNPMWVETPLLYALSRWKQGIFRNLASGKVTEIPPSQTQELSRDETDIEALFPKYDDAISDEVEVEDDEVEYEEVYVDEDDYEYESDASSVWEGSEDDDE